MWMYFKSFQARHILHGNYPAIVRGERCDCGCIASLFKPATFFTVIILPLCEVSGVIVDVLPVFSSLLNSSWELSCHYVR